MTPENFDKAIAEMKLKLEGKRMNIEPKDDGTLTPEQEAENARIKAKIEEALNRPPRNTDWLFYFDERQRRLIANCRLYAKNDPAGIPGHNLMMIISRMADILDSVKLAPMEE